MRKKEREIRALKRQKVAYKTAIEEGQTSFKSDLTTLNGKIRDKSNKIQEFCNQTGYNRDRFREQVGGKTSVGHITGNTQKYKDTLKNGLTSNNNNVIIRETGGKYTIGSDAWFKQQEERDKKAKDAYKEIAQADNVQKIATISGFSIEEIQQIKNHVFFDEHILYGGKDKFFPDYNMAIAFKRLENGIPEERDILLLKHELFESQCEKKYNLTASEAHAMATEKYDWDGLIENLFGEDGEPDDLL